MATETKETQTSTLTGFQSHSGDPAFLAAKGSFRGQSESSRHSLYTKRDDLLRDGKPGDDPEVIDLTIQINDLNVLIEDERRMLRKRHIKQLANAIQRAVSSHGYANVRSVGEAAAYNAIKSIAIATNACREQDIILSCEIKFDEGNLGELRKKRHVKQVTAMLFKITKQ